MVKLTIDNKQIEIEDGATILAAASKAGIKIMTLCHNDELSPAGACRVCVVEVDSPNGPIIVSSCSQTVMEGMVVSTKSDTVISARKMAIEVLLAHNPHSDQIAKLAQVFKLDAPRFTIKNAECILCQLCVRTCREVVGVNAITFKAQGIERDNKKAAMVWDQEKCIACGSCAYICPTDAVTVSDNYQTRVINTPDLKMEFAMKACTKCGSYYAPQKQLGYMAKTANLPLEKFDLCMDCRD